MMEHSLYHVISLNAPRLDGLSARCVIDYTDECGVLNGDSSSCLDDCGILNGENFSCTGCTISFACNYDSTATISDITLCEYESCAGCTDDTACNFDPTAILDDGTHCIYIAAGQCDCDGNVLDVCGVCGGAGSIPAGDCDCAGNIFDECGVCGGDNSSCFDDCGILNGDNSTCLDDCGILNGDNSSCGCDGIANYTINHHGYDYSTVQIGDQCWFSENCRYLPEVSDPNIGSTTEPHYSVYGYTGTDVTAAQATDNYETYGVLYNWPAVITEGICPTGWHMPSDGEFTELTYFLGGEGVAGGKMKEAGYDHWYSPNTGATNLSGWTGLPGGDRNYGGFYSYGFSGYWWSASESGSLSWGRILSSGNNDVSRNDYSRSNGFSARCVRD